MFTLGRAAIDLTTNARPLSRGLAGALGKLRGFGRAAMAALGPLITLLAPLTALLSVGAIATFTKRSYAAIDAQAKFADAIGINIEKLGGLEHAAELTGVSQEQLRMSLQRMVVNIGDAVDGTGQAVESLKDLNLSAADLENMTPDEQFKAIAEALKGVESRTKQSEIAYRLFGRQGVKVLNTLGLGADGLNEKMAEADMLGATVSREDARAVEEANDAITRMKAALGGITKSLAIGTAPIVETLANGFASLAPRIQATMQFIRESVANAFQWVAKNVMPVVLAWGGYLGAMFNAIKDVARIAFGTIGDILNNLGINMENVGSVSLGLRDTMVMAFATGEWFFENWRDVLEAGFLSVGATALAFGDRLKWLFTTSIPASLVYLGNQFHAVLTGMRELIESVFQRIVESFGLFPRIIKGEAGFGDFKKIWEGLGADVGKALLRTFKQVTDDELGIKTFDESELTKSWQQGAKDAAEKLADDFGTHLRKRFDEIAKTTGWFANLFQGLSGSTIPFQGLLNFDAGGDSKMPNLNISNEKSRSAQLLGADALFRQLLTGIAGGGQNDPHERAAKAAEKQLRTMIDVSKNTALLSKVADKLDEILQKPNAAVAAP